LRLSASHHPVSLHKMAKKGRQSTGSQAGKVAAAAPSPAATPKTKAKQAAEPKSATPVSKKAAKAPTPELEVAEEDEQDWEDENSEDEDDEDDGVTEEGMQRLMALLEKEDALDDFDMAQLGEGSDEEEESEDGEDEEDEDEDEDEDEEEAEMDAEINDDEASAKPSKRVRISTEEDVQEATEGDLALDDLESDLSVDEDAIPQRKVTKNNKVRRPCEHQ
jgi:rRNA-processing protein EBP2